jgi:hypothetical protein
MKQKISTLVTVFEKKMQYKTVCDDNITVFSAAEWNAFRKRFSGKFYYNTINVLSE